MGDPGAYRWVLKERYLCFGERAIVLLGEFLAVVVVVFVVVNNYQIS